MVKKSENEVFTNEDTNTTGILPETAEESFTLPTNESEYAQEPIVEQEHVSVTQPNDDNDASEHMKQDLQLLSKIKQPKGKAVRPIVFRGSKDTVHTIEAHATIQDPVLEERKRAAADLMHSFMTRRPLTGKVFGVRSAFDRKAGNEDNVLYYVSVAYGPYQVIIPSDKFADIDYEHLLESYRVTSPNLTMNEVVRTYLTTRMGAEVDFIVSNIPEGDLTDANVVGGDRIEAMRFKRIRLWYGTTDTGSFRMNEGDKAEARVVSAARGGIRAEIYGVETYIPSRELSWNMLQNAAAKFAPGSKILVKLTKIERSYDENYSVSFEASAKRAEEDRREEAMSIFQEGGTYVGTVSYIRMPTFERPNITPAVMVTMPNGLQCRCPMPLSTMTPTIGAKVYVTITHRDLTAKKIYGRIFRMFES